MNEQAQAASAASRPRDGEWRFLHPPRGTCLAGCLSYGFCHCGCGARPKRSNVTSVAAGRYRDEPYVFRSGHQLRVHHPRAGAWSKNGVEVERIRPLILWLRERLGSVRAVASASRIPESTLRGYLYNTKRKRIPPDPARRIVALVLWHRRRGSLASLSDGLRAESPS